MASGRIVGDRPWSFDPGKIYARSSQAPTLHVFLALPTSQPSLGLVIGEGGTSTEFYHVHFARRILNTNNPAYLAV